MPVLPARSSARTPGRFDATATMGSPASISAWRFVPSPLTSTPITRPTIPTPSTARLEPADHEVAGGDVPLPDDGAVPDPDVEHATELVLGDPVLREPREHRGPLPRSRIEHRADPGRQRTREIPRDAAAGDVGERADVGARPERTNVVQVAPGRREQEVGVERAVAHDAADEREPVRVDSRRGKAQDDVALGGARAVDQVGRDRRGRPPSRRSRPPRRGRSRAARPSRRRGSRIPPRGTPRPPPRRARRPAPGRSCSQQRSRGRRAARRPS